MVDAVLAIGEQCADAARKLDSDAIFERWLDTLPDRQRRRGFKRSPGFVADTLEMTGCWRGLPAIYDRGRRGYQRGSGHAGRLGAPVAHMSMGLACTSRFAETWMSSATALVSRTMGCRQRRPSSGIMQP